MHTAHSKILRSQPNLTCKWRTAFFFFCLVTVASIIKRATRKKSVTAALSSMKQKQRVSKWEKRKEKTKSQQHKRNQLSPTSDTTLASNQQICPRADHSMKTWFLKTQGWVSRRGSRKGRTKKQGGGTVDPTMVCTKPVFCSGPRQSTLVCRPAGAALYSGDDQTKKKNEQRKTQTPPLHLRRWECCKW